MTFPGGTHDIWLRYWMAAAGINQKSVGIITIPPPQMVANMRVDNMEGYCVGEPWNGLAAAQNIGFTHVATQDLWKHHPEKALVVNAGFATTNREDLKNIMKAIIRSLQVAGQYGQPQESCRLVDQTQLCECSLTGDRSTPGRFLRPRLRTGRAENTSDDYMTFYNNGVVNMPHKSHGYLVPGAICTLWYVKDRSGLQRHYGKADPG